MHNGVRNMRFDPKRKAVGDKAEQEFSKTVEFIRFATDYEDKYLRFDMIVNLGDGELCVDVMSFNPKRKHGDQAYIELVNNYGFPGWAVPNGIKYRAVAWEQPQDWIVVMISEIDKLVKSGDYEAKEFRHGSMLMMVPFETLRDVSYKVIPKL